jgi:RNA polymerase sigma factor (sigma-70 family)
VDKDDTEYVVRMKLGDRSAFDMIYEKYSNRILRSAYLLTGDYQLGEDITQETFVKCFLHCRELKENARFSVWLIQIMHRTAWKMLGSRKAEIPDEDIEAAAEGSDGSDCLTSVLESEQSLEIDRALNGLNNKYREVLVLFYYDELSVAEIAGVTGCFEGTVKSRLFKARALLKAQLKLQDEKEVVLNAERENV